LGSTSWRDGAAAAVVARSPRHGEWLAMMSFFGEALNAVPDEGRLMEFYATPNLNDIAESVITMGVVHICLLIFNGYRQFQSCDKTPVSYLCRGDRLSGVPDYPTRIGNQAEFRKLPSGDTWTPCPCVPRQRKH
jgi:hypothetical protein